MGRPKSCQINTWQVPEPAVSHVACNASPRSQGLCCWRFRPQWLDITVRHDAVAHAVPGMAGYNLQYDAPGTAWMRKSWRGSCLLAASRCRMP